MENRQSLWIYDEYLEELLDLSYCINLFKKDTHYSESPSTYDIKVITTKGGMVFTYDKNKEIRDNAFEHIVNILNNNNLHKFNPKDKLIKL